jgi:anti-anti-sigma regulatory factor
VTLKGPVPSGELRISIEQLPSVAVVQVSGEVDLATTPRLTGALEAAQRADANVALDMTGVEFLDFNRVGGADRGRPPRHGRRAPCMMSSPSLESRFVVVGAIPSTRRIMLIAGLDAVLSSRPTSTRWRADRLAHGANPNLQPRRQRLVS